MPHESFIQWLTPYSISSVRYQMVSPRVSCFRPACFYLLTIHPLKWVHVAFCFFASLFAIELLLGHLQFIPVTVSYRPRYASFFLQSVRSALNPPTEKCPSYTLYLRQPHFHLFFHNQKWPKCCDITLQTQSTGLRHPSLEEGARKRCSECVSEQHLLRNSIIWLVLGRL